MNIIETDWKWNGTLLRRRSTSLIVLHHAATTVCAAHQIDNWHKGNGWSGIGYHFFIRKDGSIYRGRPIWAVGAHAEGRNSNSIGVCVEGNLDNENITAKQKESLKELLSYLKQQYPNADIKGHREVGATGCPGKNYPLEEMKDYWNNGEESEELTMTQYEELKDAIKDLTAKVEELSKPEMVYNYIDNNMPEWAREGVRFCIDNGIIEGTGEGLGLDDKDLKYCTIIMRLYKSLTV